ncbi:heme lyase CcmF/NrfE family subunit, partial [candidate division KSB1 bacterium]|nr:heme lyase CcmF/NrfE family subunit [candidate division KSB1 bacterium]NIR72859.1 heme lyase CcmF/NrfE family subunit [candidate division KSB1 bacterium]NIS23758.1 heme lyase CcmF/NrfE family subunit [candidate division KSB1 bacterium]NIT70679.1 heme lyase CcmF/NrfE family subunit [candidate division KSB1 bacterium]NIU24408.1 heme lyase CcmF/NrfE family subunit [candidate division KSB1 bacterium]
MNSIASGLLLLAFVLSGYAAWAAFMGGRWRNSRMIASAERSAVALFAVTSVVMAALVYAFITRDFSLEYVAHYSNRTLPMFYTISAVWAGQSGSLLLWAWLLTLFAAVVVWQNRYKNRELLPYVLGVILFTSFFFFGLMVYATSPFEPLPRPVVDGSGLNPMLQNVGMVMHPPTLYLGYVGFVVPFAFAIAAMITKNLDAQWIRSTRRWTLFSWLFLTLGNLFGAKWAYVELGWGGYWAWDPVENASLMPWLTGTAFLHSVMIQEKRGMLKVWNLVLIILTFALTIFGTFITRSGIISSVHSFGISNLGPLFLIFLGITLVGSFGLLWWRWPNLKSENRLDAVLSRESSFLFNNLFLVGMTFAVFWGTIFPIISEAVRGVKITVGAPFFNQVNVPIGLALLALTGICPLIAWRKASERNLHKSFTIPLSAGVLGANALFVLGVRSLYPLIAFSLAVFVMVTIILEFYRGANARAHSAQLIFVRAFWDLLMRNKRRYGGYIVHIGVVMIFVGITGSSAFQKEKAA